MNGADDASAQEPLGLTSVLVSALPPELGTPAAPERYTVPVVFTRQVTPAERARIEDPALAHRLSESLGGQIELLVSDRRLLVRNTSLAELRDGLAAALAAALRELDLQLDAEQSARDDAAGQRQLEERERADAVAREAAQIDFA